MEKKDEMRLLTYMYTILAWHRFGYGAERKRENGMNKMGRPTSTKNENEWLRVRVNVIELAGIARVGFVFPVQQ